MNDNSNILNVLVITPDKTLFKGKASALSLINEKGVLDILPKHANFMSTIKNKITVYLGNNNKIEIPVEKAVVKATNNEVLILSNFKI